MALATVASSAAQTKTQATMPWVRNLPSNRAAIIFVHGVMGDERSTWTSGDHYWPSMLTDDPTFNGQNIYVYHYPSPRLSRTFSIDEIAENMRLVLTTDGVLRHNELTFVSHSMGGLVTRAFILKYQRDVVPKIRFLYFFATPTTGSPFAILANIVSRNPQFKQLYPMQSDNYLGPLQSNWLAADLGLKSYCAYETQPLYGQIIVERQSATNLCTQHLDSIDADHVTIVRPANQSSTPYRALKGAFLETAHHVTTEPQQATGRVEDPVLHIEPERAIVWSTRPGQTLGVYTVSLHNTGVAVDVLQISKKYFLAQRGKDLIIKRLPEITDSHKGFLEHSKSFPIPINFNAYLKDIKEVAANFPEGPSMAGIYIVARCRRHIDGKDFTFSQAYGLFNFEAVAIFTEGTSMDSVPVPFVPVPLRSQSLTLHEVIPYLDSPERWTSITKELSIDADGKSHIRQY